MQFSHSIGDAARDVLGAYSQPDGRLSPAAIAVMLYGELAQTDPGTMARQTYALPRSTYVLNVWRGPSLNVSARVGPRGGLGLWALATLPGGESWSVRWHLKAGWTWPEFRRLVERVAAAAEAWQDEQIAAQRAREVAA